MDGSLITGFGYSSTHDAEQLIDMYRAIDECPFPGYRTSQGAAFGGGVGLLAVCDIVVAAEHATFALSETKSGTGAGGDLPIFASQSRGVIPATLLPDRPETFSASVARQFHLIHEVVGDGRAGQAGSLNSSRQF